MKSKGRALRRQERCLADQRQLSQFAIIKECGKSVCVLGVREGGGERGKGKKERKKKRKGLER